MAIGVLCGSWCVVWLLVCCVAAGVLCGSWCVVWQLVDFVCLFLIFLLFFKENLSFEPLFLYFVI
jgi:hypothetical protein